MKPIKTPGHHHVSGLLKSHTYNIKSVKVTPHNHQQHRISPLYHEWSTTAKKL